MKPAVEGIREVCYSLSQKRSDDHSLVSTVTTKLHSAESSHAKLTIDADVRYKLLQDALLMGQEFESIFEDFMRCLEDLEMRLAGMKPLDARLEILRVVITEHEVSSDRFLLLKRQIV